MSDVMFTWHINDTDIKDVSLLRLLVNYKKNGTENEYEVSENIYKAMRSLIQGSLKANAFSYLLGEKQDIVLYQKKHFRVNKGDDDVLELALGYAELQGIDKEAVRKALRPE